MMIRPSPEELEEARADADHAEQALPILAEALAVLEKVKPFLTALEMVGFTPLGLEDVRSDMLGLLGGVKELERSAHQCIADKEEAVSDFYFGVYPYTESVTR